MDNVSKNSDLQRYATPYDWRVFVKTLRCLVLNLTQEEFSRLLKVSVYTVQGWDRGVQPRRLHQRNIQRLAEKAGFLKESWPLRGSGQLRPVAASSDQAADK
jgi:transcriptional regulator with XRE-family HTH domain